jgi:hypothetical protein
MIYEGYPKVGEIFIYDCYSMDEIKTKKARLLALKILMY